MEALTHLVEFIGNRDLLELDRIEQPGLEPVADRRTSQVLVFALKNPIRDGQDPDGAELR
jgi:hypothetical protein